MPAYGSQCLPLSTGFWYFLIFFLICLASFHCSAGFHALDLWVSRWLLRGVVMMHSTDRQLFIPPGLQIIHIYASGSRLFSWVAAILEVDQSHLLHRAQGISTSSRAENFLFGCPCQEIAGEGCKDSNTEAEHAGMVGRQTQNGKKHLEFAQTPVVPPAGTSWGQQWTEGTTLVHGQSHANRYAASYSQKLRHLGQISSFFFVCLFFS